MKWLWPSHVLGLDNRISAEVISECSHSLHISYRTRGTLRGHGRLRAINIEALRPPGKWISSAGDFSDVTGKKEMFYCKRHGFLKIQDVNQASGRDEHAMSV